MRSIIWVGQGAARSNLLWLRFSGKKEMKEFCHSVKKNIKLALPNVSIESEGIEIVEKEASIPPDL